MFEQHLSRKRVAVGVQSAGTDSYERVAGAYAPRIGNSAAIDDSDRESRQVIFARMVQVAGLAGFTAHEACTGKPASIRHALDDLKDDLLLELAEADVVEKEEGTGAMADDVVDAHRDTIDPDRVVPSGGEGDLELGSDAVGPRNEDGMAHPAGGAVDGKKRTEAADSTDHARIRGLARDASDYRNQGLLEGDIDSGSLVGHPPRHRSHPSFLASAAARHADVVSE